MSLVMRLIISGMNVPANNPHFTPHGFSANDLGRSMNDFMGYFRLDHQEYLGL